MSQVKKYEEGSGPSGIQQATPSNQFTFKVNGGDYKLDEQAIRDKFSGIFDHLVKSGEAKESDRDKWIQSNEQVIGNMRKAPYDLTSSGKSLYTAQYEGQGSNESLGLNDDGSTARKTKLGNLFARLSKNDAQRVSMINGLLGNSILGDYNTSQADMKAKALAETKKNNKLGQDNALNTISKLKQSYGESAYGKDYTDDPSLIYKNWFNDKTTSSSARYSALLNNYTDRYKQLYSPDLDKYKDYLKEKGFDLEDMRNHASQNWDPTTQKFKGKYNKLTDFLPLSNPFDTMHNDNLFMDKVAYDKSIKDAAATAATGTGQGSAPVTNQPNPLTQQGNLWTDGHQFFKDKDKKVMQTGFDDQGRLYSDNGTIFNGWYLHNGNPDAEQTGYYEQGKYSGNNRAMNIIHGKNYMQALAKNPANASKLDEYSKQYSQITGAYDRVLSGDKDNAWLNAKDAPTSNATYNVWANVQQNGKAFQKTRDVTALYPGVGNKANVQAYVTQALNEYGRPQILHMVTLPNHKQYHGVIQTDVLNNVTGMKDVNGKDITDPALLSAIKGVTYNVNADNSQNYNNTTYDSSSISGSTQPINPVTGIGKYAYKSGGVVSKNQAGGLIGHTTGSGTGGGMTEHSVTIGDIGKSIKDPGYSISGADKAELAALALNVGSLATSIFGGGGAGVAAGLGAAGTATQYGADLAKHGFNWSDLGSAALGLGLDAASIVPGLGVLSEGAKVTKTLAKTARMLVPALTALGLAHGAGVVMDLASGKKSFTDLNVDDLRALTQGITAVTGGARAITQRVGTQAGKISSVTLKDGTPVQLDDAGLSAINSATDKAAAMKSVVARLTGKSSNDVELASKMKLQTPNSWNVFKGFGIKGSVDNTKLITESTGRTPIDPTGIQGPGLLNAFRRYAATKATQRDLNVNYPTIDPKYKIGNGGDIEENSPSIAGGRNNPMTLLGDFWQKPRTTYNAAKNDPNDLGTVMGARRETSGDYTSSPAEPTYNYEPGKTATVGDIPDTRRMYGSMFGLRSIDNERSISFNDIRNRVMGLKGTKSTRDQLTKFMDQKFQDGTFEKQMQDQINEAVTNKGSRGYVKFKEGGSISKKQWGGLFQLDNTFKSLGAQIGTIQDDPYGVNKVAAKAQGLTSTPLGSPSVPSGYSRSRVGIDDGSNNLSLPSAPKFSINPVSLSELGRALYTSNFNKGIDTRVERPMLSAPMEVPISIRGNLYAQNIANQQADNIVKNSQQFRTSDGSLQMLGNLEAERQAGGIRMQGAMQNNQALEQSRMQAQQNAMQNVQARTNVANENIQTNARATQAERQAENEKRSMIQQPLLDFWKDQDYKSYIQGQQNRAIDTQIGGIGVENMNRGVAQQLQQAMNKVWYDDTIPQDQKMNAYNKYANQLQSLMSKQTQTELQLRKNPYGTKIPGLDYFNEGVDIPGLYKYNGSGVPTQKDGGSVTLQKETIKANARTNDNIAKQGQDFMKQGLEEETKKQMEAMKEINDLIKMALK